MVLIYRVSVTNQMNINAHTPTVLLKPFIKTYLVIESQNELANLVNKVVPDTSLIIAFRYKGRINYAANENEKNIPSAAFSGLTRSARTFNYSKDTGNIIVIFKEAMAAAFFKEPLHELFEEIVSLDNFISHQDLSIMEEQLAGAKNNIQRIDLVDRFLLSKLCNHKPDKLILTALQKIRQSNGVIKMKDLANTLCISQDPFEKRFRQSVGTSPKQFSSIVRMKSIINSRYQKQKLTEIIFNAGYFDQPHFNKDFKLFTGQSPTDFFNSPSPLQINDFLQ
jgi:AraC-like DNA-binding protein